MQNIYIIRRGIFYLNNASIQNFIKMKNNLSAFEIVIRFTLALFFVLKGAYLEWCWILLGTVFIYDLLTGFYGFCPIKQFYNSKFLRHENYG